MRNAQPTPPGRWLSKEIEMQTTTTLLVRRSSYGEIISSADGRRHATLDDAKSLIVGAQKTGKLPETFDNITRDRKGRFDGEARHIELYDVAPSGKQALVCVRESEGSKYGVATRSKTYFIIARHARGVRVVAANKAVAAKAAKAAGETIGSAIDVALGKACLKMPEGKVYVGYKLVARTTEPGKFTSVFDKSCWAFNQERCERATDNHTGGFYYYPTLEQALQAAAENDVFHSSRSHHQLAIIEVQARGTHYVHQGRHETTKLCATRIMPIREIASTL
jgi:hypothetical protein